MRRKFYKKKTELTLMADKCFGISYFQRKTYYINCVANFCNSFPLYLGLLNCLRGAYQSNQFYVHEFHILNLFLVGTGEFVFGILGDKSPCDQKKIKFKYETSTNVGLQERKKMGNDYVTSAFISVLLRKAD